MKNKLNEKNVMILGDLTNKLEQLKNVSNLYTTEEFEEKFNEIKNLFEINKLPFKYSFETFISNLELKTDKNSYDEIEEDEEYEDEYESYSYSYSYDD